MMMVSGFKLAIVSVTGFITVAALMPFLCHATVMFGLQQTSYTVSESAGSVQICAELKAGLLRATDGVTLWMRTLQGIK